MATVTTVRLTSTGVTHIGENHDRMCGFWLIQVSGTFSGTLKFRKKLPTDTVANASAYLFDVEDVQDYTTVDKATGVTAAGLYKAVVDGASLILDYTYTSGTCVVELLPMLG
ncbi:hypothetical protein [Caudoviricetes sp.]|nr:hypothetical protein [Caudoviricetes sp.]